MTGCIDAILIKVDCTTWNQLAYNLIKNSCSGRFSNSIGLIETAN